MQGFGKHPAKWVAAAVAVGWLVYLAASYPTDDERRRFDVARWKAMQQELRADTLRAFADCAADANQAELARVCAEGARAVAHANGGALRSLQAQIDKAERHVASSSE